MLIVSHHLSDKKYIKLNMKRIYLLVTFVIVLISGYSQTVRIAAASNLRFLFENIKTKYTLLYPNVKIDIIIGSSGALTQQIINGAPFDFFMSADNIYPEKLKLQGVVNGEIKTYAYGRLVLWSNTLDVSKGLEMLSSNKISRIAIAKPDIAPYGTRAIECLKYYKIYDKIKDKLIFADNISQAAQFAQSGNAEVAFLAYALTFEPEMKGSTYILDSKSYKPIEQSCVLLKSSKQNPEASKLMKFILSKNCKPIFEKYGFIVP